MCIKEGGFGGECFSLVMLGSGERLNNFFSEINIYFGGRKIK